MDYFKVKNWGTFQHYKDRNPPWIKLHYELLASRDWVTLSDASRVLAVACMLIASRNEGRVPNDPDYIKRVAYLNKTPDFKPLLKCGFITGCGPAQADASNLHTNACSETETETETEAYTEEEPSCPNSGELIPVKEYQVSVIDCTLKLGQMMLANDPKAKIPQTLKQRDSWYDAIDKIHRLDGRSFREILDVIHWCQNDDFWKTNILSASKLRKQFPQLLAKMNQPKSAGPQTRFGNQDKLLETLKEMDDGRPEEGSCWDSTNLQRTDAEGKDRRLLGGSGGD